jgi:hypothetical protein
MSMHHPRDRGYTLTATETAELAEVTLPRLRSLVAGGLLPCLLWHTASGDEWFHPDDVRTLRELLSTKAEAAKSERRVMDTSEAIQRYLVERPPIGDYDQAIERGFPVIARSRAGRLHAHVQADVLASWVEANHPELPTASIEMSLASTLVELGAPRIRGLSALYGGGQRWHYWYRLPLHMWSASPDLASMLHSMAGGREDGERVVRRGHQPPRLAEPMRVGDE